MDNTIIEQYKLINWSDLLRKELGDAGRLHEAKAVLDRIKIFLDRFVNSELIDSLPSQAINEIQTYVKSFADFSSATILVYSDTSQKKQIVEQIKNQEFTIITALGKYSTYLDAIGLRDNKEEELRLIKFRKQEQEITETLNTVKELSERAKQVAQGEEAKKFGNDFELQADNHRGAAGSNFWLMITCAGLTVFLAVILLVGEQRKFVLIEDLSSWSNFLKFISEQNILLYIIIFSLLSFLISHFSRNFSSEKNLENVYRQKQRALDSHQQVLKSVQGTESQNDLETQNALLTYVAKAIFDTKETGYLKGVHHNTSPTGPILEITKNK